MRVTNAYFCHTCNVPFALYSESKIRFTGSLFITRIRLYSRATRVGKIADVHHEKGKRRVSAYTLVAY